LGNRLRVLSIDGRIETGCFESRSDLFRFFTRMRGSDHHTPRLRLRIVNGVRVFARRLLNFFFVFFCFFTRGCPTDNHSKCRVVSNGLSWR
jgi:hypothetical protein